MEDILGAGTATPLTLTLPRWVNVAPASVFCQAYLDDCVPELIYTDESRDFGARTHTCRVETHLDACLIPRAPSFGLNTSKSPGTPPDSAYSLRNPIFRKRFFVYFHP